MKKIYAIADIRENNLEWITEPIILDNDVQASMAYADYQRNLLKNHLKIDDLRIYLIGSFDNENPYEPILAKEPREIPVNLTGEDDE